MKKKAWFIILVAVIIAIIAIVMITNKQSAAIDSAQTTSEPQLTSEPTPVATAETETEVAEIPEVNATGTVVSSAGSEVPEFSAGGEPIPEVTAAGTSRTSGEYVPDENELPLKPLEPEE